MTEILAVPIAYLIGSIPSGLIIARLFGIRDIRKVGSGNIGATNVWRSAGRLPGIIVLILDIAKGSIAVILADSLSTGIINAEYLRLGSGLTAIIGHIFPIFLMFRGGKGVNTALGVMITLLPIEASIAVAAFALTLAISKYVSLGSIVAAIAFSLSVALGIMFGWSNTNPIYIPISVVLVLLIIITHRGNINRLRSGTESKFNFHSTQSGESGKHA